MAEETPDRITISFPSSAGIDKETIDRLVEESECETRSEWIRRRLAEASDADGSS